ncbi:MAG TPA: lysylphosphatidylglycerol synthase transmembrane domain-containing protein [Microthrixaceae bacterium]|jgi:hypothetical protein|nr:lysylphosphatidylglycerol synthase transmembrane domain-containing protein [Microthrixaceae bacterium]
MAGTSPRAERRGRWTRTAIASVAIGGLALFVAAEWSQVADAATLLVHAEPWWIAWGCAASVLSIVLFAAVRSTLLAAGGAHLGLGRSSAASFAAGAVAASLPGGGAIATGYMVQRYREAGADGGLAAWTTIATGVVAPSVLVFITLGGYGVGGSGLGDHPLRVVVPAVAAVALLGGFFAIAHSPSLLRRPAEACIRVWNWVRRRWSHVTDADLVDPGIAADRFVESFGSVHPGPARWASAWGLQVLSWAGELVALFAAIAAVGGTLPHEPSGWGRLVAIYGAAQLAGAIPIIPGGAGQVEAALVVGLVATGTDESTAIAASVAFRLMSHWLVVPVGWVCFVALRRRGADLPRPPDS